MTPFQKQVIDEAERYEAEKKKEKREEARERGRNGNTPTQNSRAQGSSPNNSDMNQEETVRWVNKDLNPDHAAHNS